MDPALIGHAATASVIAFFHAALPTHWLPFALVGRAQGWSGARAAAIAAAAAAGHTLVTAAVGIGIAALGLEVAERVERAEALGAIVLIAFGVLYATLDLRHLGHRHQAHEAEECAHGHAPAAATAAARPLSDRAAIASLVVPLSVSPCIALSPIFFRTGEIGLWAAGVIALVNAAVTIPVMTAMVALAARGLSAVRLERVERFERLAVGLLLVGLGGAALLLHGHAHEAGGG